MKRLTLGMLLALVASAILVAPGSAGKPADGVSCGPTTTVTWTPGTVFWSVQIVTTTCSSFVFASVPGVPLNGPGSASFETPAGAVGASGAIIPKKGPGIPITDTNCSV